MGPERIGVWPWPRSSAPWLVVGAARRPGGGGDLARRSRSHRARDRNVLLVTIDTLRADALGSYGGRAATPNLDGWPRRGARFTFAHAHAVLTLPSHASILTGRYPYEHGIRDNNGYRVRAGEDDARRRELKALRLRTGAFISAFPLDQRYGLHAGLRRLRRSPSARSARRPSSPCPSGALMRPSRPRVDWIGRQRGKWFGWVHVFDPHAPYAPPAEWQARYPTDAYAGEVAWTDSALGPLFARLDRESRPTLVIVTADHGESLGEHGEMTHGVFAYESTLHVPLIVAEITPGGPEGRGADVDAPARHVDIVPTILDALGAAGAEAAGRLTVLERDEAETPSYFESMMPVLARGWAPLRGVLVGREKYIDLPIPELYDLSARSS